MHQSYQQFDTIIDLASDGGKVEVIEGIEAVKLAEVGKFAGVGKYAEARELPNAIKLVEADDLVGFVTFGEKKVLTLEGEAKVGKIGMRGPLREVKEVILEGTGCDWAIGPIAIEELRNNAGKVEDVSLSEISGHPNAVEDTDQPNRATLFHKETSQLTVHDFQCHHGVIAWHRSRVNTIHNAFGVGPKSSAPLIEVFIIPNQSSVCGNSKYTAQGLNGV